MPLGEGRSDPAGPHVDSPFPGDGFYRFLRYGHILSSLLREFLEESFLEQCCGRQLNRAQFCFLKLIARNAELQVGEIARCIGVSPAAASKNLDHLEELGLVVRETSPEDRRATLLSASPSGYSLVADFERLKAARLAPAIHELGEKRAMQLCDLLQDVCLKLLANQPRRGEPCLRCAGYYREDCAIEELQGECALRPRRGAEA